MSKRIFVPLIAVCFIACGKSTHLEEQARKAASAPATVHTRTPADRWSGFYRMDSARCTPPSAHAQCTTDLKDCLRIEMDQGSYRVELHSTQAYEHVCAFRIQMWEKDGELVYDSPRGQVLLRRTGKHLVIASDGIDPTAGGLGFCGAYADINTLAFPLSGKTETDAKCFDEGP